MFDFDAFARAGDRPMWMRAVLVAAGLAALGAAAAFLFAYRPVTAYWPFMAYGLAPVFVASMLAAIGAPIVWIGWSGEFAAIRGGALNILVSAGGIGAYCMWLSWNTPGGALMLFGAGNLAAAMVAFVLFSATAQQAWIDTRPMPRLVRAAFGVFAIALLLVGGALVLRQDVFPWPLDERSAVVYGLGFLGAAVYFAWGVARPVWGNGKGQLIGFLAYDLVLIVPFVRLWLEAPSLSLAIYIAVLVLSGALAIGYLLVSSRWRLGTAP